MISSNTSVWAAREISYYDYVEKVMTMGFERMKNKDNKDRGSS